MSDPPRGLIAHEGRLNLLCCLRDEGPMAVNGLGERTGKSPAAVSYLLAPLDEYGLVRQTGESINGKPLYEVRLDDQPAWVREAVDEHCAKS
jgi:DNA-binding transcriptional ArsR family regulator